MDEPVPPGIMDRETFRRTLEEVGRTRMPFGKYGPGAFPPDGLPIDELSLEYLEWFRGKGGFPQGRLGALLAFVHQIKAVGMDEVFEPARQARGGRTPKPGRPKSLRFDS
jgi:uncharacterized protein (DUF3820 family)